MLHPQNITGIILAGGQSKRMGQEKASLLWKDKRLVDHAVETLSPLCQELLISSNNSDLIVRELEILPDRYKNIGPIAGIEAGLSKAANDICIIVSCDTPLLPTEMFQYMIEEHHDFDISLAAHEGINEPMIGIYSKRVYPVIREAIENGENKPPTIIRMNRWQEINIHKGLNFYSADMFRNLNRPEDL